MPACVFPGLAGGQCVDLVPRSLGRGWQAGAGNFSMADTHSPVVLHCRKFSSIPGLYCQVPVVPPPVLARNVSTLPDMPA